MDANTMILNVTTHEPCFAQGYLKTFLPGNKPGFFNDTHFDFTQSFHKLTKNSIMLILFFQGTSHWSSASCSTLWHLVLCNPSLTKSPVHHKSTPWWTVCLQCRLKCISVCCRNMNGHNTLFQRDCWKNNTPFHVASQDHDSIEEMFPKQQLCSIVSFMEAAFFVVGNFTLNSKKQWKMKDFMEI